MTLNKNLIFTVTHGRTGTTFLTEVFKIFHDTLSLHEPEPNYAQSLPKIKSDPRHAISFLETKLEHIKSIKEKNYAETSNVFGKGFLIPLLRMNVTPGLIFLNRNFRDTATSLYNRGSTPMRTQRGQHYSADPRIPGSLSIYNPNNLSDYQLCYWGVLDAFSRQLQAASIYDAQGCSRYCWATADDLHDFSFLKKMGDIFNLSIHDESLAKGHHEDIKSVHYNPNRKVNPTTSLLSFDNEESEVLDRIAYYEPLIVDRILSSQFIEHSVSSIFGVPQTEGTL